MQSPCSISDALLKSAPCPEYQVGTQVAFLSKDLSTFIYEPTTPWESPHPQLDMLVSEQLMPWYEAKENVSMPFPGTTKTKPV